MVKKKLLADSVYEKMRERIFKGIYPQGLRLVEADLTEEFGGSRITIREAIRSLEQDGLVVSAPNKGAKVRQIDRKSYMDMQVIRAQLDALAAQLAAGKEDADLSEIEQILDQERELLEKEDRGVKEEIEALDLNDRFHAGIHKITGNESLCRICKQLQLQSRLVTYHTLISIENSQESAQQHAALLEALRAHDEQLSFQLAYEHAMSGARSAGRFFPEEI